MVFLLKDESSILGGRVGEAKPPNKISFKLNYLNFRVLLLYFSFV